MKSIATAPNQPTLHVELTPQEKATRKVEETKHIAEQKATAWLRGRQDPVTGYATVQDQLDMQYNDMMNNTTTWFDHIGKVKKDNPKP